MPEYLSVVRKIADSEGRTTRRAYAKMTSKEGAGDSGKPVDLSPENEVRKSGRARNAVDYTRFSGSENTPREMSVPGQIDEGDKSLAQESKQVSPSPSASSTSNRSTLMPDHPSRSSSKSTATNTEPSERPNLSWNAIVYEVLATSNTPLTFPQLVQGIKDRFPYFNSSSQDSILKSGPKNPLYFHKAFCKAEVIDGKQTWTLKPGEFIDKKTGEVLTPRPRHTISSPRLTKQAHEMQDQTRGESTSKSSPSFNDRSNNPRFGRETLDSPEIPDSQEAKATTPNSHEADNRIATEQTPPLEEPTGAREVDNATDDISANAFVGTSLSGQTPQPRFQWATTTFSPINATSASRLSVAAGTMIQSAQNPIGAMDDEASGIPAPSLSADQAVQTPASSIPSSTREIEHDCASTTAQTASSSVPLVHTVSPTFVPTLLGDSPATPQITSITPAVSTPSVTSVPCTQLYVTLSHSSPNVCTIFWWLGLTDYIVTVSCQTGRPELRKLHTCPRRDGSNTSAKLSGTMCQCSAQVTTMLNVLNEPFVP